MTGKNSCLFLLAVMIVVTAYGCDHNHLSDANTLTWIKQWEGLPSEWRYHSITDSSQSTEPPDVLLVGARGFRYGQINGIIYLTLPVSAVTSPPLQNDVVLVQCVDINDCHGVTYRAGADYVRFLLWISRGAVRTSAVSPQGLALLNNEGKQIAILPPLVKSYDLDLQSEAKVPVDEVFRCVSAEARLLATSEVERLAKDERAGRVDHDTVKRLQKTLIRYLSSSEEACFDPKPKE